MPLYRSPAIILHYLPWKETDKLVFLFTRNFGKLKGIAYGARRPRSRFGGSLESLTLVHAICFVREGKELATIDTCDVLYPFMRIKEDFERLKRALYALELSDLILPLGEPSPKLFGSLYRFLLLLEEEKPEKLDQWLRVFEIRALQLAGFAPQMEECVLCGEPPGNSACHFCPELGGLVCPGCLSQAPGWVRVSLPSIHFIRETLAGRQTRPRPSAPSLGEVQRLVQRHIQAHLGRGLHSARILDL